MKEDPEPDTCVGATARGGPEGEVLTESRVGQNSRQVAESFLMYCLLLSAGVLCEQICWQVQDEGFASSVRVIWVGVEIGASPNRARTVERGVKL